MNRAGRAAGDPELVLYGTTQVGGASVDPGGRVFFASQNVRTNLWSFAVDGTRVTEVAPVPLTRSAATDLWPSIAADGSILAFVSSSGGRDGIWVSDLTGAPRSVVTGGARSPAISPDGRRIAYSSFPGPGGSLFLVETRGGVPRQVCTQCATFV